MKLQTSKPSGQTDKRKMALIPVLAAFLIWNLTSSDDNSRQGSASESVSRTAQTLTEAEAMIAQLKKNQERAEQKNWPHFELNDVLEFDPFSLAGTLAERSGVQPAEQLVAAADTAASNPSADSPPTEPDPKENPVRAVAIGRHGAAALVDSRIVRVGDEVEEGIRIVAIERNAIVVEMID